MNGHPEEEGVKFNKFLCRSQIFCSSTLCITSRFHIFLIYLCYFFEEPYLSLLDTTYLCSLVELNFVGGYFQFLTIGWSIV